MKISLKIILPVITMLVLAVILSSVIGYTNISREIDNVMRITTENTTSDLVLNISKGVSETEKLKASLNSNFLRIARALAAYIEDREEMPNTEEMISLAKRIGVDEIHIVNSDGVLFAGSVEGFYGFDFATSEQTKPFLKLIDDNSLELAQDPSFRAVDGVLFQYIGVPLKNNKGLVQIGVRPTELQDLINNNTKQNIISQYNFKNSGYGYFIDNSNIVTAHVLEDRIGQDIRDLDFGDRIVNERNGSFIYTYNGVEVYTSFKEISNGIIVTAVPTEEYRQKLIPILISLIITAILSIVVLTLTMVYLINKITSPLGTVSKALEDISSGNLTRNIDKTLLERKDEVGTLTNSLLIMTENLKDIVTEVSSTSGKVASGSIELAKGNKSLSERTEQQAAALEETSAAVEEMTSSIRSNADNTVKADSLSQDTLTKTKDGSDAVSIMVDSMNNISSSSNRIADIIDVINNIAFQTNLLALNASIEAARAGEQGKGFAVVAVEVRKLAKRSDKAASEITDIIKSSNNIVVEGVKKAQNAGEILDEVYTAVSKVTELIREISSTSKEQLISIDQINETLSTLDHNTQENAEMVEEASASTSELSNKAVELNEHLKFFTIHNE